MTLPWYTLEIISHFAAWSVMVNGIGQSTDRNLPSADERFPINAWIATGTNTLEAVVWVPPAKTQRPPKMDFTVRVCRYEPESKTPIVLGERTWALPTDGSAQEFPVHLAAEFKVTTALPVWTWADADALPVDFKPDGELLAFLHGAQQALARRDLDAVVDLSRIKAVEMAAAFGVPQQKRLDDQKKFFQELFADPKFAMKPLDEKGIRLHRHAGGRLWEVTNDLGNPAVSSLALEDGSSFGLNMYVCRKHGKWLMCR
ncbi:MAG: hypothetical protein ABI036_07565 [Fibrobacteria bacterium]